MDIQLEDYHKGNSMLENQIKEIKGILSDFQKEILQKSSLRQLLLSNIKTFQGELQQCSMLIQHPIKLKELFISFFEVYSRK